MCRGNVDMAEHGVHGTSASTASEVNMPLPLSSRDTVAAGVPFTPTTQRIASWSRSSGTVMRTGNLFAVGRAAVVFAACCGGRVVLPKHALLPFLPPPTVHIFSFEARARELFVKHRL